MNNKKIIVIGVLNLLIFLIALPVFAGRSVGNFGEEILCYTILFLSIIIPILILFLKWLFGETGKKIWLKLNITPMSYVLYSFIFLFVVIYLAALGWTLWVLFFETTLRPLEVKGAPTGLLYGFIFTLTSFFITERIIDYLKKDDVSGESIIIKNIIRRFAATTIGLLVSVLTANSLVCPGNESVTIALIATIPGGIICGILQPLTNRSWLVSILFSPGIYIVSFIVLISRDLTEYLPFLIWLVEPILMCRIGIYIKSKYSKMIQFNKIINIIFLAIILPGTIFCLIKISADHKTSSPWHLQRAIQLGDIATVMEIISKNEHVINNSEEGLPPLHECVLTQKYEIAELLLKKGAKVNQKDGILNITPLFFCASKGDFKCVSLLLRYGASVEIKNNNGETAIDVAINNGHNKIADFLKQQKNK